MAPTAWALELDRLTKGFPSAHGREPFHAVDGLTLQIPQGEVVGFLGPNGCGKSTTLKMIVGLTPPSAGTFRVLGAPGATREARAKIGFVPEPLPLHRHLSAREMVQFHGRMAGLGGKHLLERVERVLQETGLEPAADRRLGTFSTGMLRRAAVAQALVHDPQLLLLDEPTAGVDPEGVEDVLQMIGSQRRSGRTVVIASHLLSQVETVCDRVALFDRGRLLAFDTVAGLLGPGASECIVLEGLTEADHRHLEAWLAERKLAGRSQPLTGAGLHRVFLRKIAQSRPLQSG